MGIMLALVIGGAVVFAIAYWSPDAVNKRKLKRAQRYRIADLTENTLGRLVGAATPIDVTLTAPLSGRPCVMYIARVEEQHRSGKTTTWRTKVREAQSVRFVLADGSGRAIIDPTGAELALEFDSRSRSGTFDDPTPAEKAFLERHMQSGSGFLGFNRTLRYSEAIIEVGEQVAVLGQGIREPDPDAPPVDAYRGDAPTRLRLTSSAQHPLVISDAPETQR
jgi:hypothetical protein